MVIERDAFYPLSGLVFLLCSTTPPQPGHSNQGLWSRFWWGSCVCVLSRFIHVWFFTILWTVARQAPLSVGFSRQEFYWSGLSCPSPGDLPNSGMKHLLHWQVGSLPLEPPGNPGGGLNGPQMDAVCVSVERWGTWPVTKWEEEGMIPPNWFVASVRIRELGRNGILKKEPTHVCKLPFCWANKLLLSLVLLIFNFLHCK